MTKAKSTPQRKLAAIMFTDIAGYTAAMSADEETALKTLRKKRSILKPLISDNNGTFVKEIGDGTLSYFRSAIDAATCAVSLQQATYDDADMNLRIGVHVGDIVFDDEDVFGDGVNVAARLESMAPVGGVCVSKTVFEELLNKKEFAGVPLGLQQLKGVGRLIDVFALKATNLIHPDPKEYEEHKVKPHSDDEVPSVAVLPLKNKGKEEDAFYAYGITADLITDLSRAGRIRVVSMDDIATADVINLSSKEAAKKLHVRYIVNGMLWKHEDVFQLSIEMDDTTSNTVIWSDRWQEPWDELTTIKNKLTEGLINALNVDVDISETNKVYDANTEAYEYYLKGKYKYEMRQNVEDLEIARGLFNKAIELDDTLLQAKTSLGWSYFFTGDYNQALNIHEETYKQAERLLDKHGISESLRGIGMVYDRVGDHGEALKSYTLSFESCEELNDKRGMAISLNGIGGAYLMKCEYDKALKNLTLSLEIGEKLCDNRVISRTLGNIGSLYCLAGDYDKALETFDRAYQIQQELLNKYGISRFLDDIGYCHYLKCDYRNAIGYLEKARLIQKELEQFEGIIALGTITFLLLSYKNMDKEYDLKEYYSLIGKTKLIYYEITYGIFLLLGNKSYLDTAYKQVQEKVEAMENEIRDKFLNYPIPKAIVAAWGEIQK